MKEKLKEFIKNNDLTFSEGERNTNITILCGYALAIGESTMACKKSIPKEQSTAEVNKEIERVYHYADTHNYANFWSTEGARKQYIFF